MSEVVLAVVPDRAARAELLDAMADAGHDVVVTPDGPTALDLAAGRSLRAVVVDLERTGAAAAASLLDALREQSGSPTLASIALGAGNGTSIAAAFDVLLSGPIEPARLLGALEALDPARRARRDSEPPAPSIAAPASHLREVTGDVAVSLPDPRPARLVVAHEPPESRALRSVELSLLGTVCETIARAQGSAPVLDEVLDHCREMPGVQAGAVYLRSSRGGLRVAAAVGFRDRSALHGLFGARALLDAAVLSGQAIHIPSVRVGESLARSVLSRAGVSGLVAVPFGGGTDALGALVFGLDVPAPTPEQSGFIVAVAEQLRQALALADAVSALARSRHRTFERLALAAEFRDPETATHTERVSDHCALLARLAGMSERDCELLRLASMLHDIGKLGVPDAILLKPGPLTDEERTEMQRHTEYGHRILHSDDDELLELAAAVALTHHERWDGNGYPRGLAGTEIPLVGRIVAVADVFDAVTSDRVYRPAMSLEPALELMRDGRGTHFDPELLDLFLGALPEILAARDERLAAGGGEMPSTGAASPLASPCPEVPFGRRAHRQRRRRTRPSAGS